MASETPTYYGLKGNNTTLHNVTESEKITYLAELQAQTTRIMLPAIVLLILFAVVGLFGNTLVLIAYSQKLRKTATQIFIMAIASFDLVTNVLVIPAEVYDMFHIWDFDNPHMCRARYFVTSVTTVSSAALLLALSIVRYRKVCRPFGKQVSVKQAKVQCLFLAIVSLIVCIPFPLLYGTETKKTPRPDIVGYECSIDDSVKNTIWPTVNSSMLLIVFLSLCIPLVVMYVLIGAQAWRHSKKYGLSTVSTNAHLNVTSGGNFHSSTSTQSMTFAKHSSSCGTGTSEKRFAQMCELKNGGGDYVSEGGNESPNTSREDGAVSSTGRVTSRTTERGMIFSNDNDGSGKTGDMKLHNAAGNVSVHEAADSNAKQQNKTSQVSAPFIKKISFNQTSSQENYNNAHHPTGTEQGNEQNTAVEDETVDETSKGQKNRKNNPTDKMYVTKSKKIRPGIIKVRSSVGRKKSPASTLGQPAERRGMGRTTTMLFAASAVYILGFLPHLMVMLFRFASPKKFAAMDTVDQTFYNLFIRFFFLNSAANPVIYCMCDINFRLHFLKVFNPKRKLKYSSDS
ncbi:muscarinic acetylcholine receptor M3 [Aplysia californica]|uniref:Muscarinic acetylcholine receptor M3 n=1 Tax=Aplysia californica TaxID=6500 RepID=A0ABM0K7P1_APLCA|nr:muscarinic acetylcholine receptor M3 [Aplysia californica]XP_005110728.1 muscarinic acetylcholine receptor M3 [Aplysia californica]